MTSIFVRLYDENTPQNSIVIRGELSPPIVDEEAGIEADDDNNSVDSKRSRQQSRKSRANIVQDIDKKRVITCENVNLASILSNGVSLVRAEISRNGTDFSNHVPRKMIFHSFHPTDVSCAMFPFSESHNIVITGNSFINSKDAVCEVELKLIIDDPMKAKGKMSGDVNNYLEHIETVACDSEHQLTFQLPPIATYFGGKANKVPPYNGFNVQVSFRIEDGDYLVENCFTLHYYSDKAVTVIPDIVKFSGGTPLSVTCPSFLFPSQTAKVHFISKEPPLAQSISDVEFMPESNSIVHRIICKNPSFMPQQDEVAIIPKTLFVAVSLDGTTMPDEKNWFEVKCFNALVFSDITPPKGGFPLNSNVTLQIKNLVQSKICIVRLFGNDPTVFASSNGTIDENAQTVTFSVPGDLLSVAPPVVTGKTSMYYVGVCIDGANFDNSGNAILQIKS